jgi:hypothetical protein
LRVTSCRGSDRSSHRAPSGPTPTRTVRDARRDRVGRWRTKVSDSEREVRDVTRVGDPEGSQAEATDRFSGTVRPSCRSASLPSRMGRHRVAEFISPEGRVWLASKVLLTAVRAHCIRSAASRTGQEPPMDTVCAGHRRMVGAGGVEPPPSSVPAKDGEPLCGTRFPRSRVTVGAEVKCSHSVQLNALLTRSRLH